MRVTSVLRTPLPAPPPPNPPPPHTQGALACILSLATNATDSLLIDHLSCVFNNIACGPRRTQATQGGLVKRLVYLADTSTSVV